MYLVLALVGAFLATGLLTARPFLDKLRTDTTGCRLALSR